MITPPYKLDNVRALADTKALLHIKKVVSTYPDSAVAEVYVLSTNTYWTHAGGVGVLFPVIQWCVKYEDS